MNSCSQLGESFEHTPSIAMASKWTVTEQLLTFGHSALLCNKVLNLAPRIFDARWPMTKSRESITLLLPSRDKGLSDTSMKNRELRTTSVRTDDASEMLEERWIQLTNGCFSAYFIELVQLNSTSEGFEIVDFDLVDHQTILRCEQRLNMLGQWR